MLLALALFLHEHKTKAMWNVCFCCKCNLIKMAQTCSAMFSHRFLGEG